MSNLKKNKSSERLNNLMFTFSLLIGNLALLFAIIAFILNLTDLGYYYLAAFILYVYCAYLSKNGSTYLSRIIFFTLLNLSIAITSSFIGKAGSVEYMFIYSIALPFSLFSFKKEKIYVYFFSNLSGLLWILLAITDFKLFKETPIDIETASTLIYPISVTSVFFMVIAQLFYFSILGTRYYSKIHIKKQEAEEASLAKSNFLSTMSHEIRTPLNAVIGLSHILRDNQPRKDQINNIEALNYSGKTLLSLLNNVLDFSKMQSTSIELDQIPTDIYADIKQLKKIHEPACLQKGISLKIEIDDNIPFVCLDIIRFSQVLNNLVSNAIKFTDKGSVFIIIKKTKQEKDTVTLYFEVKDTGIGIPEDKHETIWEAFTQASSNTNRL
jgi:signal transduction histidine kinase